VRHTINKEYGPESTPPEPLDISNRRSAGCVFIFFSAKYFLKNILEFFSSLSSQNPRRFL
jgi:hypothetical protein